MATQAGHQPIVLYHYEGSPYSRRVLWYLALRGIPFSQCRQPRILPRPDLALLGVKYRRIPIMTIGRDVYVDTRLILQKLEQLPAEKPRLGASTPEHLAIERLLETLVMDARLSKSVVQMLPTNLPALQNEAFIKDRQDLLGAALDFSIEAREAARPQAIDEVKRAVEFLETTLLSDGRDWVLGTETPSLADIEAVWPLVWLSAVPGGFPPEHISASLYPKVFAWIERFRATLSEATEALPSPTTLSGEEAAQAIWKASYNEAEGEVDANNPTVQKLGLTKGQRVQIWPTDTGSTYKDSGSLVTVNLKELAVEVEAEGGTVRIHAPRHGFAVGVYSEDS